MTANFVTEALAQRRRRNAAGDDKVGTLDGVWLCLKAESGNEASDRIAIRVVHFVHPYWGLEQEVAPARVLRLTIWPKQSAEELRDRIFA